ncbi:MAG: hypothetical protein IJU82_02420, partial [Ruminiclostridium sp.]|nr:hypothetical protein [Ruminiclostridium sp.]
TSRNVSAEKHAESAFFSNPKSCKTGFGTTTAKRQLLRTHLLLTRQLSKALGKREREFERAETLSRKGLLFLPHAPQGADRR